MKKLLYFLFLSVAGTMQLAAQPEGALCGVFSVSSTTKVYFSKGNLQYQASTNTWRFAESQISYIGSNNANISSTYIGWIDLFGWGTGNNPTNSSTTDSNYSSFNDWGNKPISNGGNTANQWRTLTKAEWNYLIFTRSTSSGIRYAKAKVNGTQGLIILPDNWSTSYYALSNTNSTGAAFTTNTISLTDWASKLEANGAVFLPAAGYRLGKNLNNGGTNGGYWSSTSNGSSYAYNFDFSSSHIDLRSGRRCVGLLIRLISKQSVTYYSVNATSNPTAGGSVTGTGSFLSCQNCTLTALANEGYTFANWTENGVVVSTDAEYSFNVDVNRNLVANFVEDVIEEYITVCDSYTWHGQIYNESGVYSYDNERLYLTINHSENETLEPVTECDTYTWHGVAYTESQTLTFDTLTAEGCARHETLVLTINHSENETLEPETECDSYTWHGVPYTESQTLTFDTLTAEGCARHETLVLTINHSEDVTLEPVTVCDSYDWYGETVTTSQVLTKEKTDANGCAYTETLNLMVNHAEDVTLEPVTICDSYDWYGETITTSQVLTQEKTDANGCSYIETLNLTVNHADDVTLEPVTVCDSYDWYGETITTSQVLTKEKTDANGCTYTETLNLTVNHADDVTLEPVTVCDSYTWHGVAYTESQTLTFDTLTIEGCPRHETLVLTINHSENETLEPVTECDSYTWHGVPYTESQTLTFDTLTAEGCARHETLVLTINHSETETLEPVTECDSYTWHGVPYTESQTLTFDTLTAEGCPRHETLVLTVNHSENETLEPVAECDTYTWHGVTYTESQTLTFDTLTAEGCARHETLVLTINHSEDETLEPVIECDTYTWHGVAYTESQTLTFDTLTAEGCARHETLVLTIPVVEAIITGVTEIEVGEEATLTAEGGVSYEWSNGETNQSITVSPTSDTTYSVTVTDANGCTATAEVTIHVTEGINEAENAINIYPNPTKYVVNIEAENITHVRMIDMLGQTLFETNETGNVVRIDMGTYAVGQYFLQVTTSNGIVTRKVVKK